MQIVRETAGRGLSTAVGAKGSELDAMTSVLQQSAVPLGKPFPSTSVWESPRIVSKICQFLSLSKLLLVRRCNRALLQAAQYRMRYVLYKSLYVLLQQEPGYYPVKMEGQHCPLSAEALIQLLGLEQSEVDAVK